MYQLFELLMDVKNNFLSANYNWTNLKDIQLHNTVDRYIQFL